MGGTSLSGAKGVADQETTPFAPLRDVPPFMEYVRLIVMRLLGVG